MITARGIVFREVIFMKKRLLSLFIATLMCFSAVAEEQSTETAITKADPFKCWHGCVGDISYSLPGMPIACVREDNWEEEWTDCIMIWGTCVYDNAEYQLRHADISAVIEGYQKAFPDKDDVWIKYNALYHFASGNIKAHDGETDTPKVDPEKQLMIFNYTYPDTPGSTYQAKCYLDGTRAVCLFMEECEHCDKAMSCLTRMTEDEQVKWVGRKPYMLNFFSIPMTFPHEPVIVEDDLSTCAICFADEYTRILAQFSHFGLTIDIDDLTEAEDCMKMLAERVMEALGGGTILEGKLSGDKTQWEYNYRFMVDNSFNTVVPEAFTWIGRIYCGESGICYLQCDDTETGQAWINSIGDTPRETFDSIIRMEGDILVAEPRKADASPATLRQFCKDFINLLKTDADDGLFFEDDSLIGDAIWSDGKWIRTFLCGYSDMFMTLSLSSDSLDAKINEIHVIVSKEQDESSFNILSSCCIQAAEGSADPALRMLKTKAAPKNNKNFTWTGKRYEASQSHPDNINDSLNYLMSIKAHNPESLQREPGEWGMEDDYPVPAATISEFCSRWYRLNWNNYEGAFPLYEITTVPLDGNIVHGFAFGDTTTVLLTTQTDDEDAGIIRAQVYNTKGNESETYLGGIMSLAAVTDMPDDQFILITAMLQEYPTWQDLTGLLPIAGWSGKLLTVTDIDTDGDIIPAAYILDMPLP